MNLSTTQMYLRVVDKVRPLVRDILCIIYNIGRVQAMIIMKLHDPYIKNNVLYFETGLTMMCPWNCISNKQVNNQHVSTFLTAGNIKLILLHGGRSEDAIKNFFHEVHELYVKVGPMY